jgi:hypothetical protein
MKETLQRLENVITTKIQEGITELEKLPLSSEEFARCLSNIMSSIKLKNAFTVTDDCDKCESNSDQQDKIIEVKTEEE